MMPFFPWKQAFNSGTVWFSLWVMLAFGSIAVLAPWVSPYDPFQEHIFQTNLPPVWVKTPTDPGQAEFLLGTDRFGRDILSRMIYGIRTTCLLALAAVPLAALIGTLLGLLSGFAGGTIDLMITRFTDMVQSLPGIMFLVMVVLIFRILLAPTWINGLLTLVVGFTAVSWVSLARLVRVDVIRLKSQLFVEAAVALGASPLRIITRHLLPNVLYLILVWVINNIPAVILLEAVLGYIGVGVTGATDGSEFTVVSFGGIFFASRSVMGRNPLMLVIPTLSILLISTSFILLADFLNGISQREQA